ncbi:serine protease [Paraburkholderia unamae]|uniref:S8 family serine peptidase n=1 Tax=Paraburkholderia unamae TaxID=219649 RepID=UPI000DC60053|nr:S8 family serine peptidase [Paraburkholderia unamae]RAR62478.1 serine protease [Paraburkholderia unamae]
MQGKRIRTALFRLAPITLSLTIAACGGSDAGSALASSNEAVLPAVAKAQLAAAASAAASENVDPEIWARVKASAIRDDSVTDRFIVKYKDGSTERKDGGTIEQKLKQLTAAFPAKAHHLRRLGVGADVLTSERKLNATEAKAFMRAIASDPNVEYVEPDVQMNADAVPNDPLYLKEWYLHSNLPPYNQNAGIRAVDAWDISTGAGSVIAIVDTGITSHSDYNANLLPGQDLLGTERTGTGMNPGVTSGQCEVSWHGTHVAGIAAAIANNNVGVAGVAPNAKILSVRVLNGCGLGSLSDVADGITWAAGGTLPNVRANATPANIINLSLGGNSACSVTMQNAIDFATSKGSIVVAAAGNDAIDVSRHQPSNCKNVIAVGGSGLRGSYAGSNYGPGIDIAAPGEYILSTYDAGTAAPSGETYAELNGTSMAAPAVSGVVALINSIAPGKYNVNEMRTLLQQTVQPFPYKLDRVLGAGIVDATNAVKTAKAANPPVAADFDCQQQITTQRVNCTDRSTSRGGVAIKSVEWNWGDGKPVSVFGPGVNPVREYEYPGNYTMKVTATDVNGNSSSISRPMVITELPSTYLAPDTETALNIKVNSEAYINLQIPKGTKKITATLNINNNNESVYFALKNSLTLISPDCRKDGGKGTYVCAVDTPPQGKYFIMVYSVFQTTINGATLKYSLSQ